MADEIRDIRPATLGAPMAFCDLCWKALAEDGYVVIELRVLCPECLERFNDERDRRFPRHRINFTIGLCKRGMYAGERPDPGPNDLGGRT